MKPKDYLSAFWVIRMQVELKEVCMWLCFGGGGKIEKSFRAHSGRPYIHLGMQYVHTLCCQYSSILCLFVCMARKPRQIQTDQKWRRQTQTRSFMYLPSQKQVGQMKDSRAHFQVYYRSPGGFTVQQMLIRPTGSPCTAYCLSVRAFAVLGIHIHFHPRMILPTNRR